MLWIIQKDGLYLDNRREDLLTALDRLSIPTMLVDIDNYEITSSHEIDDSQPIMTNGSIMLSKIAQKRGWTPGSMFNENFDYNVWGEHYKDMLLNKNATLTKLEKAYQIYDTIGDSVFVRPVLDNKSFNGKVMTKNELIEFVKNSIEGKKGFPNAQTEILVSSPKKIGQEHRHYIVDGQVVTSSRYKLSGQPNFSEGADVAVLALVEKTINTFQPARAFVLDTYVSGDEIGIVETGCICHAGLYRADVMKLIYALDSMQVEHRKEENKMFKLKF